MAVIEAAPRESGSADSFTRGLAWATVVGLILVLAMTAALVYLVMSQSGAPRTAEERLLYGLETAVESYPTRPGPWVRYAEALVQVNQLSKAERVLSDAEEFLGEQPYFEVARARILFASGDSGDAIELLETAIEEIHVAREAEMKAYSAESVSMAATSLDDDLVDAYLLLAEIHGEENDLESQLEALDAALGFAPEMADMLVVRGDVRAQLSDVDGARSDYSAALKLIPGYEPALSGLAALEE